MAIRQRRDQAKRHADRRRFERLIDIYLSDCYAKRSVARGTELADRMEASRPHVSRIIAKLFGKPLQDILREKQLAEAVRLLGIGHLSVDEVALAAAFGHRSTFYRAFRKAFGVTPMEFPGKAIKCDWTPP